LSDAEICISDKGAARDVCYYYMLVKSSATKEKKNSVLFITRKDDGDQDYNQQKLCCM
jgi:hypothetical protein